MADGHAVLTNTINNFQLFIVSFEFVVFLTLLSCDSVNMPETRNAKSFSISSSGRDGLKPGTNTEFV